MKHKKIKELGIEITEPQNIKKIPYNEIKIPKGYRMIKLWEMFWLHDSKYRDFVFGEEGWLIFACDQLSIDKKNNWARWLYRDWDDWISARGGDLLNSSEGGWVCFVKEIEGGKE